MCSPARQNRNPAPGLFYFFSFNIPLSVCCESHRATPFISPPLFPFFQSFFLFASKCLILTHLLPPQKGRNKTEASAIDIKGDIQGLEVTRDDSLSNSEERGKQMKNSCRFILKKKDD